MTLQAISKGKRIMSGIQPTGEAHIGNYFGAIRNWVQLSKATPAAQSGNKKMILMLADLHALTIPTAHKPSVLNQNCFKMATTVMGCGVDLSNALLYYQSSVSAHAALMWLLSCHSPTGYLQRMPQYNEKRNKDGNVGILTYPVMQSSDILLFDTDIVPVGADQLIHVNFTRDLVDRINAFYESDVFVKPEALVHDETALCSKVMSLRNVDQKMSKSETSHMARVELTDSHEDIVRKIKKAVTDSEGAQLTYDEEKRKGLANLIRIYAVIKQQQTSENGPYTVHDVVKEFEHEKTELFKAACGELLAEHIAPIREEIMRLRKEKKYVQSLMTENAKQAQEIAEQTLHRAKKAFGLP